MRSREWCSRILCVGALLAVGLVAPSSASATGGWATWSEGSPVKLIYATGGEIRVQFGSVTITGNTPTCVDNATVTFNVSNSTAAYKNLLAMLLAAKAGGYTVGFQGGTQCGGNGSHIAGGTEIYIYTP
jgi:hypothetical protein